MCGETEQAKNHGRTAAAAMAAAICWFPRLAKYAAETASNWPLLPAPGQSGGRRPWLPPGMPEPMCGQKGLEMGKFGPGIPADVFQQHEAPCV